MQVNQPPNRAELNKTFKDFLPEKPSVSAALPTVPPPVFVHPGKADSFEKKHAFLITTASLGFLATTGFLLFRGGKLINLSEFIKKTANKFTETAHNIGINDKAANFLDSAKARISVWMAKGLKKLQGLANFNTLKDYYAGKALESKYLKPLKLKEGFDWMTRKLTASGKNLTLSKYKAPQAQFQKLNQTLNEVCSIIEKNHSQFFPSQEAAKAAAAHIRGLAATSGDDLGKLINGFSDRFDKTVTVLNNNSMKEFLAEIKKLPGDNWKTKLMHKVDDFGEFIPYKTMKPYKDDLFRGLMADKAKLSNSVIDFHREVSTKLDDIFYSNLLYDKGHRAQYSKIKELLAQFKDPKSFFVTDRQLVKSQIGNEVQSLIETISKKPGSDNYVKKLQELSGIIKADKKGTVEDMVAYCTFLKDKNPQLYTRLLTQRDKFQKALNNAVSFETEKSYGKLLDFSLNSLVTDVFTQVAGIGTILYFLLNWKKTKEEKIAANLKTGIPFLGGLVVAFLCNLRQVASGPGALFLGFLTTIALNKIGNFTNNKYVASLKGKQPASPGLDQTKPLNA
ncbi:MAG: hypothetical protein PHX18_00515 [Candidatus Gastranaerophilales bacterium]|nr:hypothetical protein [Candidatus Gastranaerophilales bacterium]